jgi:proteic killer suppression protein
MIKSFADRDTELLFDRCPSRRLPADIQRAALRTLAYLAAARTLADLAVLPANRLEKLSGTRRGRYSIRINDRWRICFAWQHDGASEVEIVDYH